MPTEPRAVPNDGHEDPADAERHEKARALAEQALEKYAEGDQKTGDALAREAVKTDRSAVEEIVAEIDEDADSDHTPNAIE